MVLKDKFKKKKSSKLKMVDFFFVLFVVFDVLFIFLFELKLLLKKKECVKISCEGFFWGIWMVGIGKEEKKEEKKFFRFKGERLLKCDREEKLLFKGLILDKVEDKLEKMFVRLKFLSMFSILLILRFMLICEKCFSVSGKLLCCYLVDVYGLVFLLLEDMLFMFFKVVKIFGVGILSSVKKLCCI